MDRLEATILVAAADTGILSDASRDLRIPLATVSRRAHPPPNMSEQNTASAPRRCCAIR